ncbi:MAG: hypothetical protein KH021_01005 [Ruminococcus sp.]|uniref:hypothetical protein n=1 Tax=Blautia sp. TaxID=1955243 RepID=UPI000E5CC922|nr:hypothetical protein [Blautia sp.]MBS4906564.1 hypothetical protein [Ruminococcus sp.]MDU3305957.1 hypothetical protein [Lachnospiraceae bacterium]RHQ06053.1 hypothetical protein DW999_03095 [Ruminococcus sp. AM54-14NS]
MRKEKSRMINNTIYCIKYIWKIDRKYILLMIVISILTSLFNIINLSILRYITEAITMQEMKYFLMIICLMLLLSVVIAIINGSASYLYEPLLQNRIIEKIQSDIYAKAKTFNLEEYDNEEFYDLYYFVAENGKTGILNAITLTTGILTRACMCRNGIAFSSALGDSDNCSNCGCNCLPWNHGSNASTASNADRASV